MWSASPPPPHVASSNVPWTLCPTAMNVERSISVLVLLRMPGYSSAEVESWAEIYDPVKGQFEARKLSDEIGYPRPNSCFKWTDELVVIYYHNWVYGEDKQHTKPSLLSYNLRTEEWNVIAENLPGPLYHSNKKRNLVYVGCDTLFIIDSTYHWSGYNLPSNEVGKVKVEGQSKEDADDREYAFVMGTVYSGNNVCQSTGKGGDYVATVRSSGFVTIGFYSYVDIIADRVSFAEEEKMIEK
ncbi:hypothetical protein SASPL_151228 [Salvia splendens]|uniref:Uncharacterized protein n=1 Tax=Salvia splendens TaxID=180675 RepID=A0A8X8W7Z9_SALSN|nr:hypothetical protein SASPL_151228 [Salvia splendens]